MPDEANGSNPLNEALMEVIRNLRKEPPLLFGLGIAIVLAILALGGSADLRTVVLPLLGVLVIALAAWLFIRARDVQAARVQTGRVDVADDARVEETGEAVSGDIEGVGPGSGIKTGDVKVGKRADVEGKLRSGDVRRGRRGGD